MTLFPRTVNETTSRELRKTFRNPSEIFYPLIFFVLVLTMFPFAIPPVPGLFNSIASGILWTAALLAISLSLETLFKADYSSGALEVIHLSGADLVLVGAGKSLGHWIIFRTTNCLTCISYRLGVRFELSNPVGAGANPDAWKWDDEPDRRINKRPNRWVKRRRIAASYAHSAIFCTTTYIWKLCCHKCLFRDNP